MWPDYELWKGALSDVFLFFLILHNEISMSHVIDSSENLLMTGMSYFCTVSPWVFPVGRIQGFQSFFQVLVLPGFMPCSLCPSGDHSQSSQWAVGAAGQAGTLLSCSRDQLSLSLLNFVLFCPM